MLQEIRMVTVATIVLMYAGGAAAEQSARQADLGDLAQAKAIEIRDAKGVAVLKGMFDHRAESDGDIDKDARLTGTSGARGEADIDIDRDGEQELEVEARGLPANQSFSVWIDGRQVATFRTEGTRADAEWSSRPRR